MVSPSLSIATGPDFAGTDRAFWTETDAISNGAIKVSEVIPCRIALMMEILVFRTVSLAIGENVVVIKCKISEIIEIATNHPLCKNLN